MRFILVAITGGVLLAAQGLVSQTTELNRVELGQPEIFVAASDGSNEHPLLPNPDGDYDAVWSPDGESIVFTSERNGSSDLFRVNPDGSGLKALTTDPAYEIRLHFARRSKNRVRQHTRRRDGKSLDPGSDVGPHTADHYRRRRRFSTIVVS